MTGMPLTCSANTLRFADLPTRVAAATAAGFQGIGLRVSDYWEADMTDGDICALLDAHGLRILELEHTWDWSLGVDEVEETMFHIADRIGIRQLNVPMFAEHPPQDLVRPFAELCDRAAEHGVLVGFEFLPYSHIRTLDEAWQVVAAAGRPNSGVIIDLWHWFRSGGRPGDLAGLPADAVTSLQLCDVSAQAEHDLAEEARHRRLLPGHGAGDTFGLLRALGDRGVTAPVSVEVFSDDLDARPAEESARLAFGAGTAVLERARLQAADWTISLEQAPPG